jgi:hypothetical protein
MNISAYDVVFGEIGDRRARTEMNGGPYLECFGEIIKGLNC